MQISKLTAAIYCRFIENNFVLALFMKRLLILLTATILFTGCANKSLTRYEALAPVFEHNGCEATINEVKKQQEDLYGDNTEFLYYFDLGVLYHYNGNYKESADNFAKAEKVYDDLYTRSISNEAAAIVTNDNVRPYRARPFEVLVLHEMQIMNYLAQRDVDGALVEVNRALQAMTALYQKDNDKTNDNGFLRYLTAIVYEMAGEKDEAAIAYYKTVKAYNENILNLPKEAREFVIESLRRSDREDDINTLGLNASLETPKAKAALDGQEIIVIGYAGHGPILGELKMSGTYISGGGLNLTYKDGKTGKVESVTTGVPPVAGATNGQTFHISIALPEARSFRSMVHHFNVTVDNQSGIRPEKVMALDKELEMNLKDDFTNTMVRTAIRVVLRTIAAQATKKAVSKSDNIALTLFTSIGTDIAQNQLEKADLRIALFLPNSIQMTRIPVEPGSHEVTVAAEGDANNAVKVFKFNNVNVKKGEKKFLFVPAVK